MDDWVVLVLVGVGVVIGVAVAMFLRRPQTSATTYTLAKTYTNLEEWEFMKDERGRVKGVRIHRRAEES